MDKKLQQVIPEPGRLVNLQNLYLDEFGWRHENNTPTVVANFLSSLDGRIAISHSKDIEPSLPKSLTSHEDFRLFLELYAQADCLITHGGYLRALAENKLGNILQLPSNDEYKDLREWREQKGLKPNTDIVIASSSLDFSLHASLSSSDQKVYIATIENAPKDKIEFWKQKEVEILTTGPTKYVEGANLISKLDSLNYKHIYLIAGPKMLHSMIKDQQLSKLYLSTSHQILGGEYFRTILDGDVLDNCSLKMESLFYDACSDNNVGQFFSSFRCEYT